MAWFRPIAADRSGGENRRQEHRQRRSIAIQVAARRFVPAALVKR